MTDLLSRRLAGGPSINSKSLPTTLTPRVARAKTLLGRALLTLTSSADLGALSSAALISSLMAVPSLRSRERWSRRGRFTSINVSDADDELLAATEKRLKARSAPVRTFAGPASAAMPKIVQSLDPYGLHLAFLDPHNLGTLSFDLFEQLAKLTRIDVIAHVSLSDLQRNADRYTDEAYEPIRQICSRLA